MAAAMKGEEQVTLLDGRTLTLAFDFEALMEAEEVSGLRMPDIFHEMVQAELNRTVPSLRVQRALIFGALRRHHPEIALEEVGPLLLANVDKFAEASDKAMRKSIGPVEEEGDGDEDAEESPPKAGAGTGAGS